MGRGGGGRGDHLEWGGVGEGWGWEGGEPNALCAQAKTNLILHGE